MDEQFESSLYEVSILKLKSGETVIAKVLVSTESSTVMTIEDAMEVIVTTSNNNNVLRDIAFLRRWMGYTEQKKFEIPVDWIAFIVDPNDRLLNLYHTELERLNSKNKESENKDDWSNKKVSDIMKEEENGSDDSDDVQISFNMPPHIFMKLLHKFQNKNSDDFDEIDWANENDDDTETNNEGFGNTNNTDSDDPDNFDDYPKGKDDWY